ncbi:MAG: Holliday junction branch migration protein RuvA [Gammaproteobacteria bacterium]|nr:Holliday junction branch migration protein RuvA [Gammaproteobacteria bacterium]
MIGRLTGSLARKEPPALLLDVNGVGYELEAPMSTFYDLPAVGEKVTLYTHLVVREDAHLLYGFSRESQRQLFRSLLKVNGVGPRVALAVLSGLSEQELILCLAHEDIARLTKVPGIGRKTAERLVMELRDKVDLTATPAGAAARPVNVPADPAQEAVSALVALGYKPVEANRVVGGISSAGLTSEEIIRQSLKSLAGIK